MQATVTTVTQPGQTWTRQSCDAFALHRCSTCEMNVCLTNMKNKVYRAAISSKQRDSRVESSVILRISSIHYGNVHMHWQFRNTFEHFNSHIACSCKMSFIQFYRELFRCFIPKTLWVCWLTHRLLFMPYYFTLIRFGTALCLTIMCYVFITTHYNSVINNQNNRNWFFFFLLCV